MLLHRKMQRKKITRLVFSTIFVGGVFFAVAGFVLFSWLATQGEEHVAILQSMAIYTSGVSSELEVTIPPKYIEEAVDPRNTEKFKKKVTAVKAFFSSYGAPLAANAEDFVRAADTYGIDYRLLPAISIVESTGGKKLFRAYNPFGWGRSGYASFKAAIYDVARGMSNYYAGGLRTPQKIAYRYNPVTPEAWGRNVASLMNRMPAL